MMIFKKTGSVPLQRFFRVLNPKKKGFKTFPVFCEAFRMGLVESLLDGTTDEGAQGHKFAVNAMKNRLQIVLHARM